MNNNPMKSEGAAAIQKVIQHTLQANSNNRLTGFYNSPLKRPLNAIKKGLPVKVSP